ncbi:MAG: sigma factor-like helix-turn-helix DNA-binding protein [Pseudobdellovibrionaceae bacterium]
MELVTKHENQFTPADHIIVRTAVKRLPGLLLQIMALRFWQNRSIVEVAEEIGISVKNVEDGITQALRILREECLRCPAFSRSLYNEIQDQKLKSAA